MPRPIGTLGETKYKILATIYNNEVQGIPSYGYNIWLLLKRNFFLYLDKDDLRNVYRHLKELGNLGLVKTGLEQSVKGAPTRKPYLMTEKGRELKFRFDRYLEIFQ